ncbi:DUF1848 family protein [Durusdinium trenchii]|uniref:DUF1848 family protein n=1 Tax=Durusdinium trenchii TaxID=1381693 RepID=A0ABP0MJ50_9DINO
MPTADALTFIFGCIKRSMESTIVDVPLNDPSIFLHPGGSLLPRPYGPPDGASTAHHLGPRLHSHCQEDALPSWSLGEHLTGQDAFVSLGRRWKFGNEARGVSPEVAQLAQRTLGVSTGRLCIPMSPSVDSLNVGISVGIVLHEAARPNAHSVSAASDGSAGKNRRLFSKVTEMDRIKAEARTPSILSCSRRTDVPWAFLRQYLKAFREGFLYVRSPVTGDMDPVCLKPYDASTGRGVMCISWWSKNYCKWIEEFKKQDSILHSYPVHMFNFTVNSDDKVLEPGVFPPLQERLGQVTWLASTFGAHALNVRFDPIVHYRMKGQTAVRNNLGDFEEIVKHLGLLGLGAQWESTVCGCERRTLRRALGASGVRERFSQAAAHTDVGAVRNMLSAGVELVALSEEQQRAVLDQLLPLAHRYAVEMRCCCDDTLFGHRTPVEAKADPTAESRWVGDDEGKPVETDGEAKGVGMDIPENKLLAELAPPALEVEEVEDSTLAALTAPEGLLKTDGSGDTNQRSVTERPLSISEAAVPDIAKTVETQKVANGKPSCSDASRPLTAHAIASPKVDAPATPAKKPENKGTDKSGKKKKRPLHEGMSGTQRRDFLCVKESRCLDARLADRLAKEKGLSITFPHQKDRGQREMCNCTASREIGQYELLGNQRPWGWPWGSTWSPWRAEKAINTMKYVLTRTFPVTVLDIPGPRCTLAKATCFCHIPEVTYLEAPVPQNFRPMTPVLRSPVWDHYQARG